MPGLTCPAIIFDTEHDTGLGGDRGRLELRVPGRGHADGSLKEAFEATRDALAPDFGNWPIFEHCLPLVVKRRRDEYDGIKHPRIWTAERDGGVGTRLQD
ncbi:hypothetical protein [Paracoccus shandongensis]|uniref:hypothetical protein n=1 Tax=Paracoccus shandongensis TaxID=2816048 RepID=UPI001A9000E8|nr:hypothetical protein [Paracoccus shandongensis]